MAIEWHDVLKIPLGDLRWFFSGETKIFLTHNEVQEKIPVNNYLWGTRTFEEIIVHMNRIYAIGKNKMEIKLDVPKEVFKAWLEYSKQIE